MKQAVWGKEDSKKVNEVARHQMIRRLLADILMDLSICDIEGWDKKEYITIPPKGYHIPRSEDFGFKEGHKETRRQKEKRIAKCHATRNKTIKEERARISFGLPQRTKMRLNPQNKNVVCLRSNLRKRGYIVERGSMIMYYNEDTTRCPAIENRKKGDRNYVAFTFVAI